MLHMLHDNCRGHAPLEQRLSQLWSASVLAAQERIHTMGTWMSCSLQQAAEPHIAARFILSSLPDC